MSNQFIATRKFYQNPTLEVAEALLGCTLVRSLNGKTNGKTLRARITEVEAYIGEDDLACHAKRGRTKRTEVMYGEAGFAYVYLIYGMYYCLNIVTEKLDYPAAILIRAVEIENIPKKETYGPGKLCRFLNIDKTLNSHDLTGGQKLWLEKGKTKKNEYVEKSKRINISYAEHCQDYPWRFKLLSREKE